jgi:hypothetical protein
MNFDTYQALKKIMKLTYKLDEKIQMKHYKDFNLIWQYIDEVAKEYDDQNKVCEGCGEPILEGQAIVKGENRHSVCS